MRYAVHWEHNETTEVTKIVIIGHRHYELVELCQDCSMRQNKSGFVNNTYKYCKYR